MEGIAGSSPATTTKTFPLIFEDPSATSDVEDYEELMDVSNWIAIGGGHYVDPDILTEAGMNPAQIEFVSEWACKNSSLFGNSSVGFFLRAVGYPFDFNRHPLDSPSHSDEDVQAFLALGEKVSP